MAHHETHRGRKNADEALIAALACGATVESAAAKATISRKTAHRRLKDPEFKKRLADFKAEMVRRSADMLTAASLESIKTLLDLQNATSPAVVRLGAAKAVLEIGVKLRESAEMEQRIAALEVQLKPEANN